FSKGAHDMGPFIRIALRYGVGGLVGFEVGNQLASDPDIVAVSTVVAATIVGFVTESFYALAKKYGCPLPPCDGWLSRNLACDVRAKQRMQGTSLISHALVNLPAIFGHDEGRLKNPALFPRCSTHTFLSFARSEKAQVCFTTL